MLCLIVFVQKNKRKSINLITLECRLRRLLLSYFLHSPFFHPASYSYFRFDKTQDGHIPE